MKRITAVILLCLCALCLFGCGLKEKSKEKLKQTLAPSVYTGKEKSKQFSVQMEREKYGVGMDAFSYTVRNLTDEEIMVGIPFRLEIDLGTENSPEWYGIEFGEDFAFTMEAYSVPAYGERGFSFRADSFAGSLQSGRYRLVKPEGKNLGTAFAEFEITRSDADVSKDDPYGYKLLKKLPKKYPLEQALKDGCYIASGPEGTFMHAEALSEFIQKWQTGLPAQLRIVTYTEEGDPILQDLLYFPPENSDGYFTLTKDNTRDRLTTEGIISEPAYYSFIYEKDGEIWLSNSIYSEVTYRDEPCLLFTEKMLPDSELADAVNEAQWKAYTNSIVRYRRTDGQKDLMLMDEPRSFAYQANGFSEIVMLPGTVPAGVETEGIFWADEKNIGLHLSKGEDLSYNISDRKFK